MPTQLQSRLEFVIANLRDAKPRNWPQISAGSGVPPKTIHKIAYRETKDPRCSTLDALHKYFLDNPRN